MTERKGPRFPVKLSGSVKVTTREYEDLLRDSVGDTVKKAVDRLSTVELVMVLAKVSQEQAEWLVASDMWEAHMHQMRSESFRHFQAKEREE